MIVDDPPDESSLVMEEQSGESNVDLTSFTIYVNCIADGQGPITTRVSFSKEESVIAAVSGTSTGLSASVWCGSVNTAQKLRVN